MKKYRVLKNQEGQFKVLRFYKNIDGCDRWHYLSPLGFARDSATPYESVEKAKQAIEGNRYQEQHMSDMPGDTVVFETD